MSDNVFGIEIGSFRSAFFGDVDVEVSIARYTDGGGAAVLLGDDEMLSVNVLGVDLAPGEFVVPEYKMPSILFDEAIASGFFADTGRRVAFSYVGGQPVWRFARRYRVDSEIKDSFDSLSWEPIYTGNIFDLLVADEDGETAEAAAPLAVGESASGGGGAAPLWRVERVE